MTKVLLIWWKAGDMLKAALDNGVFTLQIVKPGQSTIFTMILHK